MGGGGGRVNKPRTAASRTVARQRSKEHRKPHHRSEETLRDTTVSKLRQCRSNPRANVRLSGKKKRLLLKEAKRLAGGQAKMEVTNGADRSEDGAKVGSGDGMVEDGTIANNVTETMDTDTSPS